jgi:hypothetical protein
LALRNITGYWIWLGPAPVSVDPSVDLASYVWKGAVTGQPTSARSRTIQSFVSI